MISNRLLKLVILFSLVATSSFAATDQSREVLVDFSPDSIPALNEILNNIRDTTSVTYPISVANGGTGSATKNFVDLTTAQSVGGVKSFTSFPATPSSAPTTDYQVANKKYVDDTVGGVAVVGSYVAGTARVVHTNATQRITGQATYTKLKETTLLLEVVNGSIGVGFDLAQSGSQTAYGKVYVNGVARGTERSNAGAYATFTEIITGVNENDLIQVYGKLGSNDGSECQIKNLTILAQDFGTSNGSY